jgi:hypothetical protein
MKSDITLVISEAGQVKFLSHEADAATTGLAARLGGQTRRASHITPQSSVLRLCFHVSRLLGLAAWTRSWRCLWRADLRVSGGPVVGPFAERSEALDFEQRWLVEQWSE